MQYGKTKPIALKVMSKWQNKVHRTN